MNFDELQSKWQSHDHSTSMNFDAEIVLKEVRRSHRSMELLLLRRDIDEVAAAVIVVGVFGTLAFLWSEWTLYLIAAGGLFVGLFMITDRLIQYRRRPIPDGTLKSFVQASLTQIEHQAWLLKNVVWWYLLPIIPGLVAFLGSELWQSLGNGLGELITVVVVMLICSATLWYVYRLNQRAVRVTLEPRLEELKSLLANLTQAASDRMPS